MDEGITPDKLLYDKCNLERLVSEPMDGGMLPIRPSRTRYMDKMFPILSQVTPEPTRESQWGGFCEQSQGTVPCMAAHMSHSTLPVDLLFGELTGGSIGLEYGAATGWEVWFCAGLGLLTGLMMGGGES